MSKTRSVSRVLGGLSFPFLVTPLINLQEIGGLLRTRAAAINLRA
jgi:hypothetical protein